MPMANYCRKCKAEISPGDNCPYCGAKLSKTSERLSFGVIKTPVKDWFEWNHILRVGIPALLLVFLTALIAELAAGGVAGVEALFRQGFGQTMLWLLAGLLLCCLALLWLQGGEKVHYVLDKEGVKAYVYLQEPATLQLYARFLSPAAVEALAEGPDALEGLRLVRRVHLPWAELRGARIWREGSTLLFYRPRYWQVLAIRCPAQDLQTAEELVRLRLKRFKRVKVYPPEKKKKPTAAKPR